MGGDKRQPLEARVPPVGEDPLRSSGRRRGSECRLVKPTVYDERRWQMSGFISG